MIKLRSPLDNFHAGFRLNGFRPNDILESRDGDADAWRLEVERVAPSLKVILKFPLPKFICLTFRLLSSWRPETGGRI